jgi:hypothetical protein
MSTKKGVYYMAICGKWKYTQITPKVFQGLQAIANKKGFSIPGTPTGRFTIKAAAGMTASFKYSWNSNSGILLLECISKPTLVGCSMIKGIADNIIKESGGRTI